MLLAGTESGLSACMVPSPKASHAGRTRKARANLTTVSRGSPSIRFPDSARLVRPWATPAAWSSSVEPMSAIFLASASLYGKVRSSGLIGVLRDLLIFTSHLLADAKEK
jgi:hypothetical protein